MRRPADRLVRSMLAKPSALTSKKGLISLRIFASTVLFPRGTLREDCQEVQCVFERQFVGRPPGGLRAQVRVRAETVLQVAGDEVCCRPAPTHLAQRLVELMGDVERAHHPDEVGVAPLGPLEHRQDGSRAVRHDDIRQDTSFENHQLVGVLLPPGRLRAVP